MAISPFLSASIFAALTTVLVFINFNAAELPREIEALAAIASGAIVLMLGKAFFAMVERRESEIEKMLETAGVDNDHAALRAARFVATARERISNMESALEARPCSLKSSFAEFVAKIEPLFEDMLTSPETATRADDLVRRILPRLESSVIDYCAYAARGDGVIDTAETRSRLIGAFENAGAAADRARQDALEMSGIDVSASLDVLETSLTHSR
jgi:hypothetical protein